MRKKIISILMIVLMLVVSLTTAYATPPPNPHIGSGSYADGGYFFEYYGSSGTWKDLRTPPHWVIETGEVAYCVDHKADSPQGDETYSAFNPEALYSSRTYYGLLAIMKAGYPYQTGGLSAQQARYATANAVRAWLSESAGIGYSFMNISRGYIRPKSGCQAVYDYMVSLVNKARNNEQPVFAISTSPSNVKLNVQGNQLVGQVTVVFQNINGYYSIDTSTLPNGVSISGCTGHDGDVLTISAPTSYAGQNISLSNIFEAHDTRATSNLYWFEPSGGEQPVLVPVTDTTKPVTRGSMSFHSDAFGYIDIVKKDAATGAKLSGAVYKILNASNQEVGRLTTNAQGYAKSDNLVAGTYKLQEVTAPSGYLIDTTVHGNITVSPNNTTRVNLSDDTPKGVIRIHKTNANSAMGNYSLSGAMFEVRDSNGKLVDTVTTNSQGRANSKQLPLGTYKVKEVTAPSGFVLNSSTYTAKLEYANQTTSVVYADVSVSEQPQTGRIRITKTNANDEMGNYSLSDAVFEIRDSANKLVDTVTTNSQGKATSKNLPLGTYKIKEITAPNGYVLNENTYTAKLQYGGQTVSVVYTDVMISEQPQVGKVRVIKTNANPVMGSYSLSGAVFEVRNSDGKLVDTVTTNTQGKASSKSLPLGRYTVQEITAPNGFVLNVNTFSAELEYGGQTVSVVYDDITVAEQPQTGKIRVCKTNSNPDMGNYSLSDAEFEIRDVNGKLVEIISTDNNGKAISGNLPLGTYTVIEKAAPYGYVINDTVYTANLEYCGQTVSVVYDDLTIPNAPQTGTIKITKRDSETGGNPQGDATLDGAVFAICDATGKLIERLECGEATYAMSGELPLGTYTIKETIPPVGYVLNDTAYAVEIAYSNQTVEVNRQSYTIADDVIKGRIAIAKFAEEVLAGQGSTNPKPPLEGIEFEIRRKSSSELVDTLVTDADGLATSSALPYGTYIVTETKTVYGYIPCDPFEVFVNEHGKTYNYIIENEVIEVDVRIVKMDADTGETIPLAGTAFQIKDAAGNLVVQQLMYPTPTDIDTFVTDDSGTLTLPQPLKYGDYELIEVTAPYGYVLDETSLPFTIDDCGGTLVEVKFPDKPTMGTITIEKTGQMFTGTDTQNTEYGTTHTPIFSEQHLQGAVFDIQDSNGDTVDTITTGADGTATTKPLPLGAYTLVETFTPDGFVLDDTPIEVTLEYENQHIAVVTEQVGMNNDRQNVDIHLAKEREVISWDTLEYRFIQAGEGFVFGVFADENLTGADGNIIIEKDSLIAYAETDEDGQIAIETDLPFGKYYAKELACPTIYKLDETPYPFEVAPHPCDQRTIEIAVNDGEAICNTLIKKRLQIIKVDERDTKNVLPGAVFELRNTHGDVIEMLTTDEDGKAVSSLLPMGDYTFVEIKAPVGYVLGDVLLDVTITDDEQTMYTVVGENKPTEVTLTKTDVCDDTPLPNAHIEIYDADEQLAFEGDTDEHGKLTIYELPVGKYTFKETVAPVGYVLNETVFSFEILEDGEITGATNIEDSPTEVTLSKVDVIDGSPVANAKIEVLNSNGDAVFNGKTDENGEISTTHLPVGSYTFRETQAPEGYIVSAEEIAFTIDEYGKITGETQMTNSPTALQINKVIYETNEPLTGAGFKVKGVLGLSTLHFTQNEDGSYRFDNAGEITEIMVDENGKALIYGIPLGSYWLEEVTTPEGYYPTAPIKVTIGETNDIDAPYESVIPNSVFVKLGLDRDRYNLPIAISAITLVAAGGLLFILRRRRRRKTSK